MSFDIDIFMWAFALVVFVLGIPGNILSAIVWLRRRENSSAIYLAALAINDLFCLIVHLVRTAIIHYNMHDQLLIWFIASYVYTYACVIESLLVLGFSVERLFAILRPLQVSFHTSLCANNLLLYGAFVFCLPLFSHSKCSISSKFMVGLLTFEKLFLAIDIAKKFLSFMYF